MQMWTDHLDDDPPRPLAGARAEPGKDEHRDQLQSVPPDRNGVDLGNGEPERPVWVLDVFLRVRQLTPPLTSKRNDERDWPLTRKRMIQVLELVAQPQNA